MLAIMSAARLTESSFDRDGARSSGRVVCADVEMLSADEIDELARFVCEKQIQQVCDGIDQVLIRLARLRFYTAAIVGIGTFFSVGSSASVRIANAGEYWRLE